MPRVKDLRPTITDLDRAKQRMAEIAALECRIAVADARAEKRIADIKTKHEDDIALPKQQLGALREELAAYIQANPQQFARPRTVNTSTGRFGLRTVTDLLITDRDAVVQHCLDHGYDGALKVVRTPIKTEIQTLIEAGDSVPGAQIRTGDTVVITVSKALVKDAVEQLDD